MKNAFLSLTTLIKASSAHFTAVFISFPNGKNAESWQATRAQAQSQAVILI